MLNPFLDEHGALVGGQLAAGTLQDPARKHLCTGVQMLSLLGPLLREAGSLDI